MEISDGRFEKKYKVRRKSVTLTDNNITTEDILKIVKTNSSTYKGTRITIHLLLLF